MARQRFDIGSKWLLQNQGRGVLRVGGLENVRRCEPMPGELIQNRRYPDGLVRAFLGKDPTAHHVLIEIATYPERRALKQALDDLTLTYSALGHLPDLIMLVLRPKGKFRIEGKHAIQGKLGTSRLAVEWKSIELWTLSAEEFLSEGDVGILPWVPLMHMDAPPESVLARCAQRLEREASATQRPDMMVVSEIMTQLRFPDSDLVNLFQGAHQMIESPLVQQWKAESLHEAILAVLNDRFGAVPRDVSKALRGLHAEKKLIAMNVLASRCQDLDEFRESLLG